MTVTSDVANRLFKLEDVGTIAIHLKAEHYFDTLRGIIDNFAAKNELTTIYVTFTIPSNSITAALEALEIDLAPMHFVDAISNVMMTSSMKTEKTLYLESPTMLEYLILKIDFLIRKTKDKKNLIILDSINSIAIHNNPKILSEFLHILSNHLRSKDAHFLILSMKEYETDEVKNILNLVCEENFSVGEVKE
jgi:KaiC/GvpD/RAD55 family RecA-like ATPase